MKLSSFCKIAAFATMISCTVPMISFAGSWEHTDVNWYYTENGTHKTGWQFINGKWYYFNPSGVMLTGWVYAQGWYYLGDDGAMLANMLTPDGFLVGKDGAAVGYQESGNENEFPLPRDYIDYSYADLDGDGKKEFIGKKGTIEANYTSDIYEVNNGTYTYVGSFPSGHEAGLYAIPGNGFYMVEAQMGDAQMHHYNIVNHHVVALETTELPAGTGDDWGTFKLPFSENYEVPYYPSD